MNKKYTVTVEEDPETGDLILPFTDDMIKELGWKEGDTVKWVDNQDGSWKLVKPFRTETAAQGQRGMLIDSFDGRRYFRQYDENHDFVDYELTHFDLEIEILDSSAALIRTESGDYVDYSSDAMKVTDSVIIDKN